jgi:hypothetical protein
MFIHSDCGFSTQVNAYGTYAEAEEYMLKLMKTSLEEPEHIIDICDHMMEQMEDIVITPDTYAEVISNMTYEETEGAISALNCVGDEGQHIFNIVELTEGSSLSWRE